MDETNDEPDPEAFPIAAAPADIVVNVDDANDVSGVAGKPPRDCEREAVEEGRGVAISTANRPADDCEGLSWCSRLAAASSAARSMEGCNSRSRAVNDEAAATVSA